MSTKENAIDLTSSDDEKDCKKKRKDPEMTEKKEQKRAKKVNKCFSCEEVKEGIRATGNSLGFVCEDCAEDIPEMNFCDGCERYEETDGENLCGRCQYEMEKEYELKKQCERAFARRIGAIPDEDSSNETEVDSYSD
jgi:hypothetical protein